VGQVGADCLIQTLIQGSDPDPGRRLGVDRGELDADRGELAPFPGWWLCSPRLHPESRHTCAGDGVGVRLGHEGRYGQGRAKTGPGRRRVLKAYRDTFGAVKGCSARYCARLGASVKSIGAPVEVAVVLLRAHYFPKTPV
jgi:hypothetical protein